MLDDLKTGFILTKQSYRILRQNHSLWIFPVISFMLNAALFAAMMIPVAKVEMITWKTHHTTVNDYIFCFGILMIFFFIAHLITMWMHGALIVCAVKHMRGESYHISSGINAAVSCFAELFVWNLGMTTAGIVIRVLELFVNNWTEHRKVDEYLLGLPWLIAAIFVLPILIMEKTTTLPAVKYSSQLVAKTWGKSAHLVTTANIAFFVFISTLVAFLPAIIALAIHGKIIIWIGSTLTAILFACNSIFFSGTRTVLNSALYLFAKQENVTAFYDDTLLQKMFRVELHRH